MTSTRDFTDNITDAITDAMTDAVADVTSVAGTVNDVVSDAVNSALADFTATATDAAEAIGGAVSDAVSEAVGVAEGMVTTLDPVAFGRALGAAATQVLRRPTKLAGPLARYAAGVADAMFASAQRAMGVDAPGPIEPPKKDRRFGDPAWQTNPWFSFVLQHHLLAERMINEVVAEAELPEPTQGKAEFAAQMVADAIAPSNFLWSNPMALRRAFETGGVSVAKGLRNFVQDVAFHGGLPRKVDREAFTVGENLACSPGKVVFRNDLIELIQYEAKTETVYATPILFSPPWINKYYIMDLRPGGSFVEWAVDHGHTVFILSYCNPDESMADTSLDQYLTDGILQAIDVITSITGSPQVNVAGLCLGGTLTTMLLAYLRAKGDDRVRCATLTNTMVDFSEPGQLGVFSDPDSVEMISRKVEAAGYLDSKEMARTFDFLRANDLVWSYVATNWLMGEDPPKFDLLAWNDDSTRMAGKMYLTYLRRCYIDNALAQSQMAIAGTPLMMGAIDQDLYVLSAVEDHIAPWKSSYKTTQLVSSQTRFVLSSAGHIAGIINPPSPKTRHWTNDDLDPDPDVWLATAVEHQSSWWEDWAEWISTRAGEQVPAPPLGNAQYPAIMDAPGTYVFG